MSGHSLTPSWLVATPQLVKPASFFGSVSGLVAEPAPVPAGERSNQLLRQVDWRVLLPSSEPARVVLFGASHLREALGLVAAELYDAESPPELATCDLVVVGTSHHHHLRAAFEALRPGGCLYLEVGGIYALRGRIVRQRLTAEGFRLLGEFIPWPPPERGSPRAWLPYGEPGAAHYFLDEHTRRRGGRNRLRTRVRAAARELAWQGLVPTATAVIAVRPPDADPRPRWTVGTTRTSSPGGGDLPSTLRNEWNRLAIGGSADRCSLLLLTPGRRSVNKIVGLTFHGADPVPRMVVKMPRVPESIPALRNEEHVLRCLERFADSSLSGVPRILFSTFQGRMPVIGQSFVAGRPFAAGLTRKTARALALLATEWSSDLARCRSSTSPPRRVTALVRSVLDDFSDEFGPVVDRGLLRATEDLLEGLPVLPVTCEQRDFSPWNLKIASDGRLAVLDWESAVLDGLPLTDLLYFLAYLGFYLDAAAGPEESLRSYRAAADPGTLTGSITAECIERYSTRTGIPASVVTPLRALVWLIHARSEFRQLWRDREARPDPSALQSSLFARLWEAELRALR